MMRKMLGPAMLLLAVIAMGSNWIRPVTRPRLQPGIPERPYQTLDPSSPPVPLPVVGVSMGPIPITIAGSTKKTKSYAMDRATLITLHCSISQVAFTIDEDGNWIFNCQADQNPWFSREPSRLPPPEIRDELKVETNHLLRNEFSIRVRCLGNAPVGENLKITGRPVLAEIRLDPFWVQRGVPFPVRKEGQHNGLKTYHPAIDRVEIELSIR